MKKILIIIMAMVMLFNLVGCGNKVVYDPNNFIDDVTNPQIVKEKVTIKLFVPKSPLQGEWEEMVLFKRMEELTNVHIEFEEVALSSYTDKRTLKWKDSKNPTDGFFLSNTIGETIMSKASLRELGECIEKYAPNYKKYMEQYPAIEKLTSIDGKMYCFASIDKTGGDFSKQYINQKWLKDLNLEMPQTIIDYYNVLKAFKGYDGNGNGRPDEIPLSFVTSDQTKNFIMSAFGFVGTGIELKEDGSVEYVPTTNNYREYLKFMNKLYKEGLLDSNCYSNQSSDLAFKGTEEMLGSFASASAFLVAGNDLDNDYTALPPLTSDLNNKKMWYKFGRTIDPQTLIISAASPYYRELTRWIDVLYSKDFEVLQTYGREGVEWNYDNEEKKSWTFNIPKGMEREQFRATISYQAGLGGSVVLNDFGKYESSKQNQKQYKEREVYADYLKEAMPLTIFTVQEMQQLADIETSLGTYMSQAEAYFIKGSLNPNSEEDWKKHLKALDKMKVSALKSIYKQSYDRYMAQ